jgi:hypothetical protein
MLGGELRGRVSGDNVLRLMALATWLLVCITIVLGLAIWIGRGSPRLPVSYVGGPMGTSAVILCGLVFSSAGAYLMARAPRNLIGWVFMAVGLGMAVVLPINIALADVVRQFRLIDTPVVWLAWAVTSVQVPASGTALVIVLLLFPTGRPEWRHWRVAMGLALAGGFLISAGAALRPDGLLWYPALANPLPVPVGLRGAVGASVALGTALLVVGLAASGTWLTWRASLASGEQRRQLMWVVAGGLVMSVTLVPLFVTRYVISVPDALGERLVFAAALGTIALPVAVVVAVQREGLFGMRDLLGRSLVYLPLMALLAGLYSAGVMIFQKLFVALTGTTSDAAIVLSTLLVATSLTPARNLLETIVKRTTQGPALQAVASPVAEHHHETLEAAELVERLARLEARLALLEGAPVTAVPANTMSPATTVATARRRGGSKSKGSASPAPVSLAAGPEPLAEQRPARSRMATRRSPA